MSFKKNLLLALAFMSLGLTASSQASASVLYSNGAPAGDSGRCNSGPLHCGGSGTWTVYNQFTLSDAATITGFSNWNGAFASTGTYLGTNWSIWSATPSSAGSSLFSGSSVGVAASDSGFLKITISGLSESLAAGTYWLGINQKSTNISTYAYSNASDLAMQLDGGDYVFAGQRAMAIVINGADPAEVPEPASVMLLGLGIAGLIGARRRKTA